MGQKPFRLTPASNPIQGTRNSSRKIFLREKRRSQIQAAASVRRESPAPKLSVKKIPPKKAGPNSRNEGDAQNLRFQEEQAFLMLIREW